MASPQAENGHLDLAHELTEQLCRSPLSGSEIRVCLFILRKTWGWHKKSDCISITQIQQGTNLSRPTVCETLNKLVSKRLLFKSDNGHINSYTFNKDYQQWIVIERQLGGYKASASKEKATRLVSKRQLKVVSKRQPTKETKETYTKETIPTPIGGAREEGARTSTAYYELVEYVRSIQELKAWASKPRQFQAAKQILSAGYSLEEAKTAADRMHDDPFWRSKTFDLQHLSRHIQRYSREQTPATLPYRDISHIEEEE